MEVLEAPSLLPSKSGDPLCMVWGTPCYTQREVLYACVQVMAGRDEDFASQRNGIGFNKLHAHHGHRLASLALNSWSDHDFWVARKMMETYKNTQLRGLVDFMPPYVATPPASKFREAQEKAARNSGVKIEEQYRRVSIVDIAGRLTAVIEQNYDPELVEKIRQLPQRKWDADRKRWVVPLHLDALEPLLNFAVENGYDLPDPVMQQFNGIIEKFAETMELSSAATLEVELDLPSGLDLFPFQKAGVAYAERVGNVLIADEMGLGKTVQGLMAVKTANQFPLVVICPASLKRNWQREAKKWIPDARVTVLGPTSFAAPLRFKIGEPQKEVFVINYNSRVMEKWLPHLVALHPQSIIMDEAHACKNSKAQQTKLVDQLIRETGARVIMLSGTPVVNQPMEFYQLVKMLGHAKTLGGYAEYRRRYSAANPKQLHELNTRARTHFMVRRLKKDVLTELPPKMYSVVPIEIENRAEYDQAERDIAGYFAKKKAEDAQFISEVTRQASLFEQSDLERQQFIESAQRERFNSAYLIAVQNEQLLRWEALKQLAVRGKLRAAEQWISEFLDDSDQKIVVFVTHTATGNSIASKFNAPFIHGGVSIDDRQRFVDRFQNDPLCRVIVGNMIAMGEGLTLTAASNVAFVEFGWNAKSHSQAEDRCHRIGQHDNVTIHQLVAEETIEEEIIALIERKRVVAEAIQDGDPDTQAAFLAELRARMEDRMASRK